MSLRIFKRSKTMKMQEFETKAVSFVCVLRKRIISVKIGLTDSFLIFMMEFLQVVFPVGLHKLYSIAGGEL